MQYFRFYRLYNKRYSLLVIVHNRCLLFLYKFLLNKLIDTIKFKIKIVIHFLKMLLSTYINKLN